MNKSKMVQIELTEDTYKCLLVYKNFMSLKLHGITNPEVFKKLGMDENGNSEKGVSWELTHKLSREMDFEPEFTFGDCIMATIGSVMDEQETGVVNEIT